MSDDVSHMPRQPESDQPESSRFESEAPENDALESDAATAAAASDTFEQAADGVPGSGTLSIEPLEEEDREPQPAGKLERLQKILAQAGIASRRHAEELITQGRVQVNGKVVTELGTKADAARDHIRVDGKLLQGSERHRYYMLNKPKGFVTTVSDPEGRPTIMQFFSKIKERLYPVGRLDYLSEGLLLVTNDGELANKLTRAASNVEKTYLVKVSGQPSEEALQRLREGVPIDRVKPGSARVQTAPAQISRFNPGKVGNQRAGAPRSSDNPWFEVVLIEGRNRELRKMFEEIGHHVEKIRRVGYGPLVLDLEPGNVRELEPEEVENLRKASEGKYRKPKPREPRRRTAPPRAERENFKPRWSPPRGEGRPEENRGTREGGGTFRSGPARGNPAPRFDRRPASGPSRGPSRVPERGPFRTPPSGGARHDNRFAGSRPQRPPISGPSDRPYASGRSNEGPRENRRPFIAKPPREGGDRPKQFTPRPPRREFGANREAGPGQPQSRPFERGPQRRPAGSPPFRRDRTDQMRPDRPRREAPGSRRSGEDRPSRPDHRPDNRPTRRPATGSNQRPEPRSNQRSDQRPDQRSDQRPIRRTEQRSDRPSSGPRTGSSRPGNRGASGARPGSVRSAGGRRPGSRPAGKPAGGKRPGARPGGKSGGPGKRGPGKRRP